MKIIWLCQRLQSSCKKVLVAKAPILEGFDARENHDLSLRYEERSKTEDEDGSLEAVILDCWQLCSIVRCFATLKRESSSNTDAEMDSRARHAHTHTIAQPTRTHANTFNRPAKDQQMLSGRGREESLYSVRKRRTRKIGRECWSRQRDADKSKEKEKDKFENLGGKRGKRKENGREVEGKRRKKKKEKREEESGLRLSRTVASCKKPGTFFSYSGDALPSISLHLTISITTSQPLKRIYL